MHHGANVRLTINLDDDLYSMARSHAIATKTSISKAVGDLLRRKVASEERQAANEASFSIDPITGFPVVKSANKLIKQEEIQRILNDDMVRHLELMGLPPEEIDEHLAS
ncbi:MAG: hypothetical protein QM680_04655 [Luteolibacter sp.]